jgi:hypothetical protein
MFNSVGQSNISLVVSLTVDFPCLHEGDALYHLRLDNLDATFWLQCWAHSQGSSGRQWLERRIESSTMEYGSHRYGIPTSRLSLMQHCRFRFELDHASLKSWVRIHANGHKSTVVLYTARVSQNISVIIFGISTSEFLSCISGKRQLPESIDHMEKHRVHARSCHPLVPPSHTSSLTILTTSQAYAKTTPAIGTPSPSSATNTKSPTSNSTNRNGTQGWEKTLSTLSASKDVFPVFSTHWLGDKSIGYLGPFHGTEHELHKRVCTLQELVMQLEEFLTAPSAFLTAWPLLGDAERRRHLFTGIKETCGYVSTNYDGHSDRPYYEATGFGDRSTSTRHMLMCSVS